MKAAACCLAEVLLLGVISPERAAAEGPELFAPSPEVGKALDSARALPLTDFYASPRSVPWRPGTLVRAEPFKDYRLPAGVSAVRILYHTRTASGEDALASGVVLLPYGRPPPGGWPVLAWSHGTSGVARACAPSLMKSLFYDWEGLFQYVALGYAVVATDYAGLGTEGRHAYIDMESNATDVVHSVRAARAAVAALGRRWIAIGHSQGGLSVLGVAQLQARIRDPDFLGTVSLAGASDLEDGIDSMLAIGQPILNGLMAFVVFGAQTVSPQLDPREVLSDRSLPVYAKSVDDGCSAASGAFTTLATSQMYRAAWKDNPAMRRFLERNRPGVQPARGPILLIGGGSDVLFTPAAARKVHRRYCDAGVRVQRRVYPGLSHDAVVLGSLKDQMDWIAQRFAGAPAPTDCAGAGQ
jgi:alpha-beta hydrolase superfamily lysophospholipase